MYFGSDFCTFPGGGAIEPGFGVTFLSSCFFGSGFGLGLKICGLVLSGTTGFTTGGVLSSVGVSGLLTIR